MTYTILSRGVSQVRTSETAEIKRNYFCLRFISASFHVHGGRRSSLAVVVSTISCVTVTAVIPRLHRKNRGNGYGVMQSVVLTSRRSAAEALVDVATW